MTDLEHYYRTMGFSPDTRGECDACGRDRVPLQEITDEPGEYLYCARCLALEMRRRRRRECK